MNENNMQFFSPRAKQKIYYLLSLHQVKVKFILIIN